MTEIRIRPATADDALSISVLVETSFESGAEHALLKALRAEGQMMLELVALADGHLVGHVAFPKLQAPAGWAALSPLTVRNDHREQGIGGALVIEGLDRLRQMHVPGVVVLGDPDFYGRFGFSLDAASKLRSGYPKNNLMLLPFDQAVSHKAFDVVYPSAFLRN